MPITLNANQVPSPVVNTTLNKLATAENSLGIDGASVLKTIAQGDIFISSKWNRNLLSMELLGRFGSGAYAVLNGLALSIGTGLLLNISEGQALIDGIVEIENSTYAVPENQSRIHVWLKQDGTFTHALTTSVPSGAKVYLGSCSTDSSSVTSVDGSGVLYLKNGLPIRYTNDASVPSDSPSPDSRFFTDTPSGLYLWSGNAYRPIYTTVQLQEAVQDVVGSMVSNTTGINWTYNDTAGTLSITFDLTAFTTSSLPEGTNQYYTDQRVVDCIASSNISHSVNVETLTATKTLTLTDKNIQALTASGSNRDCRLPSTSGLEFGHWFKIINNGTSNNIVVKTNDGGTTICTLTPGKVARVEPISSSGTISWPTTITPEDY